MSESGAKIADDVPEFVISAKLKHFVVGVFQIPVVDQGHHNLQALKFSRAGKWIALPLPFADSFPVFRTCFEPDVSKSSFTGNRNARHEIVDFCYVANAPKQSDGRRFRLSLVADLRDPLATRAIAHFIL